MLATLCARTGDVDHIMASPKLGKHVSVPYLKMLDTVINYMVNGLIVNPQGHKDVVCSLKKKH